MIQLPFYWTDAFASVAYGGNPCAVVLDSDGLSVDQMQSIAKEMNLSETAFLRASKVADFSARYFTPRGELPFAGHPTIAAVHSLVQADRVHFTHQIAHLSLELPAGIIPIEVSRNGIRTKITMSQLAPKYLRSYEPEKVLGLFGLSSRDLLPEAKIQTVSTGTPILMVPLASLDALKRIRYVDPDGYLRLKAEGDFFFSHHFCPEGATSAGRTFARSLPTPPDTLEDPFTGSATGCMAAYLWRYGLITENRFIAEQGHWMGRPGAGEVERIGTPDEIQSIRLSGEAVTVVQGTISVPNA